VAGKLEAPPAIPPFYVWTPDDKEIRAAGWYMRQAQDGPPIFLGHSAAAAEVWLLKQLDRR
jgi:hypothetical protein